MTGSQNDLGVEMLVLNDLCGMKSLVFGHCLKTDVIVFCLGDSFAIFSILQHSRYTYDIIALYCSTDSSAIIDSHWHSEKI